MVMPEHDNRGKQIAKVVEGVMDDVAAVVPADKTEETAGGLVGPAADHLLLLYELAP
jgi:hypothetical protein